MRINLELIDTNNGQALWSQRYDRPYKDLFKLQDDITAAVAGALRAELLVDAPEQSERPASGNLDAYNAYLLGKFYGARNTAADKRKSIAHLTRAVEIDPGYGMAYAELGRQWNSYATGYAAGAQVEQAYAHSKSAIVRAIALAPGQAYPPVVHARLLSTRQAGQDADVEMQHAMALAPDSGIVLFGLGQARARRGDAEEAVVLTRKALESDPLNQRWHSWLSSYLLGLERLDDAQREIDKAIELQPQSEPDHYSRTTLAVLRGDSAGALAAARAGPPGVWRKLSLALALQIGNDAEAADRQLQEVIDMHARESAFQIAEIQALRRDPDALFRWLERAHAQRDPGLEGLLFSPLLLRYKDDPRFDAFVRKVGMRTEGPGGQAGP